MKFKLLTYNLLFGKALPHAWEIIQHEEPDVICTQELPTDSKNLQYLNKKPYKLVSWTNSFLKFWTIFGNAVYINTDTCELIEERNDAMPASAYDFWTFLTHGLHITRRFTETRIRHKKSGKELIIYNIHLTHFSFVDLRLAQLKVVFQCTQEVEPVMKIPILIAGDFNLYNGKTELEKMLNTYNLQEATTNLRYTFDYNLRITRLRAKLDYILFRNLTLESTRRLPLGSSDHHPIISEFTI